MWAGGQRQARVARGAEHPGESRLRSGPRIAPTSRTRPARLLRTLCLGGLLAAGGPAAAADWSTLTPFGAIRAGNADGSIPAWEGGITQPIAAYAGPGSLHADPYADDAPLYTVTAENMAEHAERLSPGLQAMLQRYPQSFRIPVYPSRRSHAAPQWVYDNTRRNADSARLSADGNGIEGAFGGIPFPLADSALQVYWNHVARWRGQYIVSRAHDANVHADGKFTLVTRKTEVKFHFYAPDGDSATLDNRLFSLLSAVTAPPRLARSGVFVREPLNQDVAERQAWIYDSGRRRVVRAPLLAFDMTVTDADGLRTADDTDMVNGSPSRFEWRLLGRREMLIPYNSYRLERTGKEQLLQAGHLDPQQTRFELHRVWVLEAVRRPQWRHVYSRRVFYLDEDSWSIAIADQYDASGTLARVSMAHLKNYYELPATLPAAYVFHDLPSGRYHVQALSEEGGEALTLQPVPDDRAFSSAALGRFVH
jgi:hypothetical protein